MKHSVRFHNQRNQSTADDDYPPLSKAQIKDLLRRKKDYEDRTRYLLASVYSATFVLYYNISNDDYILKKPERATLFKRREAAQLIQRHVNNRLQILSCRVNQSGKLIQRSVQKGKPLFPK